MMLVNHNKIHSKRRLRGTSIAELPLAMWVIFIGIGMPLLSLTLITVRYGMFVEAARQAADVACSTQTYGAGSGAVYSAYNTASSIAAVFPGVNMYDCKCWIIVTPLYGSGPAQVIGPNTPLTTPADPSQNLYQIRVDLKGYIQPILAMPLPEFINIPGLSIPIDAQVSSTRVFENPPGLSS